MEKAAWAALIFIVFLSACTTSGVTAVQVNPPLETSLKQAEPVGIPHEYIPPPGWCRVWYPERSPDKQSAPERCLEITDVPVGARLVYGGAMIKTYRIEEYDPLRSGVVNTVNYFELESGRFLRQEKIRGPISP